MATYDLYNSTTNNNVQLHITDKLPTETYSDIDTIHYIGHGFVVPSICALGILCNGLVLLVLLKGGSLTQSCYTYLMSLAVADLLSLVLFGINGIGRGHYPRTHSWATFDAFVYLPVGFITTSASIILTDAVTIERFIYLYYPMRAKRYCTAAVARKVCALLYILVILYCIPRFFMYRVDHKNELSITDFGTGTFGRFLSWFHILVISLGSCVLLSVLNILLIRCVHKSASRKRHLNQHYHAGMITSGVSHGNVLDETRLTRMFITLICVFVIGELPSALLSRGIVVAFVGGAQSQRTLHTMGYQVASMIATVLVVSQHSANFIIYSLLNRKFRAALYSTFCPGWARTKAESTNNSLATYQNNNLLRASREDLDISRTQTGC